MRITVATGPLLPVPAIQGGAVPRIWQGLAEEFARHQHHVTIVARSFPGQPAQEVIGNVQYLRWGGFPQSLSVKWDLVRDLVYALRVLRYLPASDILVSNDFWLPVFAAAIRPKAGRVVVNAGRFPKGQFKIYRGSARIAAVSTPVRDAVIRECPALASRTRVFPNPIDTTRLFPIQRSTDLEQGKELLFVGRLHPEKGVHLLVEAFARISGQYPEWRLRVVGPILEKQGGGGSTYQRQLQSLAGQAPVEFTGPVFQAESLARIYQSADLFCYPSLAERGESFGVAPLEAMACGVPVLVSDLKCFHDFITDGDSGRLFDHRCASPTLALAAALERLMLSVDKRVAIGRSGAEVARRFSYGRIAEDYLADFTELLRMNRS